MYHRYRANRGLARRLAPAVGVLALLGASAVPAAGSRDNSTQGALTYFGGVTDVHIAFSASSDVLFQASQGASGSADGMMNFQPNSHDAVDPQVGKVSVTCLNVVGDQAFMTGTASSPISTNAFTGPPHNLAPNQWIVGVWLHVVGNGGASPDQVVAGFFVNADPSHAITTSRCFGSLSAVPLPAESGHVNVDAAL